MPLKRSSSDPDILMSARGVNKENLAELFGGGAAARKGTVSPGRMDHAKRRAVKEMEANAKVASAAAGVGQEVREAKVLKEMQDLEINEEEIMETSMLNDSVRYGGVVPSSPSQWEAEEVGDEDIPGGTPTRD